MAATVTMPREHPAKFTPAVLDLLGVLSMGARTILDPFAGTGLIHWLRSENTNTVGVELEPEWASIRPGTVVGDALALPFKDHSFDCVATSPTYGNRMADHHDARDGTERVTYRHKLGRPLHPHNSGQLQWGKEYRIFHARAWHEVHRVLEPGGRFVLNISNHIRKGEEQMVSEWHRDLLTSKFRFALVADCLVKTPRMGFGANSALRVENEHVYLFRKRDK